jgi:hypothetical protein
MQKIAPVAEQSLTSLPTGPIEVLLRFENFEYWNTERIDDLPDPQELEIQVN